MRVKVYLPNGVMLDSSDLALCDSDTVVVRVRGDNSAEILLESAGESTLVAGPGDGQADPPPSRPGHAPALEQDGAE